MPTKESVIEDAAQRLVFMLKEGNAENVDLYRPDADTVVVWFDHNGTRLRIGLTAPQLD